MKFGDTVYIDDLIRDARLNDMDPEEFDSLPYGAIKLDAANRVVVYNAAEAKLAKRNPRDTIGRDFFEEIAPCTDNDLFRGRLEQLVETGKTSARFDYQFVFKWGARQVRIQFWVPDSESRWILVTPHSDED